MVKSSGGRCQILKNLMAGARYCGRHFLSLMVAEGQLPFCPLVDKYLLIYMRTDHLVFPDESVLFLPKNMYNVGNRTCKGFDHFINS